MGRTHTSIAMTSSGDGIASQIIADGQRSSAPAQPCVIGATGGSGTRVFARLASAGGLAIGGDRNEAEDSLPIERFLNAWVVPFCEGGGYTPPYPAPPGMVEALTAAFDEHVASNSQGHRGHHGWKSPRSLYILPFLAQRFPGLRFLHVVRDGRDMAMSGNQLQLARYRELLLSQAERDWSEAEQSIALWNRINRRAAEVGARLGHAYLRVRLEDLCAWPVEVTTRVFHFFDLPGDPSRASQLVAPPASLGRWQRADSTVVARLEEIAGTTLKHFGYLTTAR